MSITLIPERSSHLLHSMDQFSSKSLIEIDFVLFAICIDDDSIGNRLIVVLLHQQAVSSQLEDMIAIGLISLATLDLHRDIGI